MSKKDKLPDGLFWSEERGCYRCFPDGQPLEFRRQRRDGGYPAVLAAFRQVMSEKAAGTFRRADWSARRPPAAPPAGREDDPSVAAVLDAFYGAHLAGWGAKTAANALAALQGFKDSLPAGLRTSELRPKHLTDWLANHTGWKSTSTRHLNARLIKQAWRWGKLDGRYAGENYLARFRLPPQARRAGLPAAADVAGLIAATKQQVYRDYLTLLAETGCRPQEARKLEARHFVPARRVWHFPAAESKGKKAPRVVVLNDAAFAITARLAAERTEGPLLRDKHGKPLTKGHVTNFFRRMRRRGHAKGFCAYHLRHAWATRAVLNGVDVVTVAHLLGHEDTAMFAQHYGHLAEDHAHLLAAARKATAGAAAAPPPSACAAAGPAPGP